MRALFASNLEFKRLKASDGYQIFGEAVYCSKYAMP
jgi:hypothetical protein